MKFNNKTLVEYCNTNNITLLSSEIRNKIKQPNLQKYGVENPQQNKV